MGEPKQHRSKLDPREWLPLIRSFGKWRDARYTGELTRRYLERHAPDEVAAFDDRQRAYEETVLRVRALGIEVDLYSEGEDASIDSLHN